MHLALYFTTFSLTFCCILHCI